MANETLVMEPGLNGTAPSEEEEPFVCAFYNPDFIIYSSVGSFYIPCVVMVILYFRIFKVNMHLNGVCHVILKELYAIQKQPYLKR